MLRRQRLTRRQLKLRISRNKNTFSKWFATNPAERPDLRLSAIEEICEVLAVNPCELLSSSSAEAVQLELPFESDGDGHQLELTWIDRRLIIRKGPQKDETDVQIPKAC